MRINTNMAALNAWRTMTNNSGNLQKSLERLASGYRLNRAADDAAGLAVSEKMNAQIRGLGMATRNTQDAISLVQTAEGGAAKIQEMMQRMRELAVQAGSDSLQNSDRAKLQEEFAALQAEIDRTADTVTFNNRKLLNGEAGEQAVLSSATGLKNVKAVGLSSSLTSAKLNVTVNTAATAQLTEGSIAGAAGTFDFTKALNDTTDNFAGNLDGKTMDFVQNGVTLTINFDANDTATGVTVKELTGSQFIEYVNQKAAAAGMKMELRYDATDMFHLVSTEVGSKWAITVTENAFGGGASFGLDTSANTVDAQDAVLTSIVDSTSGYTLTAADFTVDGNTVVGAAGTKYQGISFEVVNDGATGTITVTRNELTFQVGANNGEAIKTSFGNLTTSNMGIGAADINIKDKTAAGDALAKLDAALSNVSSERAKMGATQNRLENTIANLQTQSENLTAANSRIRDLDMAAEMAQFTKFQILSQASTAMLAQANQITQGVLSLLR